MPATESHCEPVHVLRRQATDWAVAAVLTFSVWIVYGRAIDVPFINDDVITVVENESIRRLWPLWGQAGPLDPDRDLPTCGRPLVNLTFALNYQWGGVNPRGYHVVNILLHTLNVLLLWALLRRTLRLPYFGGRFDKSAGPLGFAVALVWAVHPLVTEAVIYTTQRTELLVSFFYLATLYGSLRYWEAERPKWLIMAVVACWAGMASKENMVSAPVMVLLYDRTFVAGSFQAAWQKSRALYLGLASSWLLLVLLNMSGPRAASAGFHLRVSATDWWFTQAKVLLMYLKLAIWPSPLSIHYEPPYVTTIAAAWPYVLPVVVLAAVTLYLLWHRYAAGFVGAMAFAILSPTLMIPIVTEIAAERRMYLPLAALMAFVVIGGYAALCRAVASQSAIKAIVAAAVLLACVGGMASAKRLEVYRDDFTIWRDVVEHQPKNGVAAYNTGTILLDRGEPAAAMNYFAQAIAIDANDAKAEHNLGSALAALGRHDEAVAHFQRAVEIWPGYVLAQNKLGTAMLQAGRTDEAIPHFEKALDHEPNNSVAHNGLARAPLRTGRHDEAAVHARAALQITPNDAEAHNNLGAALAQTGNYREAVGHFETAVRLKPSLLQAQANLMATYASLGRAAEAQSTAEKALALARSSGDTATAKRIAAFLERYRSEPPAAGDAKAEE